MSTPEEPRERSPRRAPTAAIPPVPESLIPFDAVLRTFAGYRPTEAFYANVLARYPNLDYEREAIALADWLRAKRKDCSVRQVFNWLDRAITPQQERTNGHTQAAGRDPRLPNRPERYENEFKGLRALFPS